MALPDFQRLIEFQKLLLRFQAVKRNNYVPPSDKLENDAEHSFFLALSAWFLAANSSRSYDISKVLKYALVHDLVEIYAGDVIAFVGPEEKARKKIRETEALEKLRADLKDFSEVTDLIHSYEQREDPESRLVYATDKIQPLIMNLLDDGRVWRHHGISSKQVKEEKEKLKTSPDTEQYLSAIQELLDENPQLFSEDV